MHPFWWISYKTTVQQFKKYHNIVFSHTKNFLINKTSISRKFHIAPLIWIIIIIIIAVSFLNGYISACQVMVYMYECSTCRTTLTIKSIRPIHTTTLNTMWMHFYHSCALSHITATVAVAAAFASSSADNIFTLGIHYSTPVSVRYSYDSVMIFYD